MNEVRKGQAASFLAAASAIGLAGVLTRACPGGCTSCLTCANTLLPMGASASAVTVAFLGSAGVRARVRSRACEAAKTHEE